MYTAKCVTTSLRPMKLFFHRQFFTGKVHSKTTSSFIKYSQYSVSPAFYRLPRKRIRGDNLIGPFQSRVYVTDLREKTYTLNVDVYDVTTRRWLVTERSHAVIVDLQTRKPVTFDLESEFYKFAKAYLFRRGSMDTFHWNANAFDDNTSSFRKEAHLRVTIQQCGIDCNGHLNDSIYFKYAAQLLEQRKHTPVQPMSFHILFRREAILGNDLCFYANSSNRLHSVDVVRNDVTLATIRFDGTASMQSML